MRELRPSIEAPREGLRSDSRNHLLTLKSAPRRDYIVPILDHTIQILELLHAHKEGLRIEKIHQMTGVSKTTVYRIVRTLVASEYISKREGQVYQLAILLHHNQPSQVNHTSISIHTTH